MAPAPVVSVVTFPGRVTPIAIGGSAILVGDVRYCVQNLFPEDGTVCSTEN